VATRKLVAFVFTFALAAIAFYNIRAISMQPGFPVERLDSSWNPLLNRYKTISMSCQCSSKKRATRVGLTETGSSMHCISSTDH
jgi:hypothetical protein